MSAFLPFATSAARVNSQSPADVISPDKMRLVFDVTGYYVNRTRANVTRIKSVLKTISDVLPNVANGPQPILYRLYNCISAVSGILSHGAQEQDKRLPPNLHVIGLISEAFTNLGQFSPYIPSLQSPTEYVNMKNAIPGLLEVIKAVDASIDKILALIPQCEAHVLQSAPAIDIAQNPLIPLAAATIVAVEEAVIDLSFLMQNEDVAPSEACQMLRQWIAFMGQYSGAILTHTLTNPPALIATTSSFLAGSPPLLAVLAQVENLVHDDEQFCEAAGHIIQMMQLVNALESNIWVEYAKAVALTVPFLFAKRKEPAELVEGAGKMLALFTNHLKPSDTHDAEVTEATCRAMLAQYPTDHEQIAYVATTVTRCLAMVAGDLNSGEDVLVALAVELNKILLDLLPKIQKVAQDMTKLFMDNLVAFSERQLGFINYYCVKILGVTSLDVNDSDYVTKVDLLSSVCGGFGAAIQRLSSTCSDGQVVMKCTELAKQADDIGPVFSKWAGEILHSLASILIVRGDHISAFYNYLSSYNVHLPDVIASQEHTAVDAMAGLMNKFMLRDFSCAQKICGVINSLQSIGQYKDTSPHMRCASSLFNAILKPLPACVQNFLNLIDAQNNDINVLTLHSVVAKVPALLDSASKCAAEANQCLAYQMASPFSDLIRTHAVLPSDMSGGFADGLKQTLDTVWAMNVTCANGDRPPELDSLPQFMAALKQMLSELSSVVVKMKQPSIECELPEDVKEMRSFEGIIAGLTGKVAQMSQKLMELFKDNKQPEASSFLKGWLESARNAMNVDFEQSCSIFVDLAMKYFSSKQETKGNILNAFAPLSVALCQLSLGDAWDATIQKHHETLINLAKKVAEATAPNVWEPHVRAMLGISEAIATMKKCLALDNEAKNNLCLETLAFGLSALHRCRSKSISPDAKELADSVVALNQLEVLFKAANKEGTLAGQIQQTLPMAISGAIDPSKLGGFLLEFAKKLRELQGPDIFAVSSVSDNEVLLDMIYAQLGIYRDCSTRILTDAKTGDAAEEELAKQMTSITFCSSMSGAIALRALDLLRIRETVLVSKYLSSYSDIISSLAKFVTPVENISIMPADSQSHELRRHSRKIARMFDNMIDMIEGGTQPEPVSNPFESLKIAFLAKLAGVINVVANLSWSASTAFVPEMFTTDKQKVESASASALRDAQTAASTLIAKAVGSTKDDFSRTLTELDASLKQLIAASANIDFAATFVAKPIVLEAEKTAEVINAVMLACDSLVDHVVLDPDPDAAAKLGDDYVLPSLPSGGLELDEAFGLYSQGRDKFNKSLDEFKAALSDQLALSATLLGAYNKLKSATDEFATNCMKLAVATPDPRLQVEQHTALHTFSDAFSCVKDALRSRLMRADGFDSEMTEALNTLSSAYQRVSELADAASKCPKPTHASAEDDSALDDVSRELKASANAIEEMSARLQSFSDQIDATGVTFNEDLAQMDLEAEKGTLPAYVIANANPILIAAQKILVRAQQITAEMIAKFGKIENEKLLIRSAQELSESAALLLICAEILIAGEDNDADFKAITAARIIRASVASLVAQVLVKGGDREGVMDQQVKIVKQYADNIINRAEKIVLEKTKVEESKVKKVGPKLVQKLNLQDRINKVRVQLQNQEKVLYQFRKRF